MDTNYSKISDKPSQIRQAAETLGVPDWVIHYAKYQTKSNDRQIVYDHVKKIKDIKLEVSFNSEP